MRCCATVMLRTTVPCLLNMVDVSILKRQLTFPVAIFSSNGCLSVAEPGLLISNLQIGDEGKGRGSWIALEVVEDRHVE